MEQFENIEQENQSSQFIPPTQFQLTFDKMTHDMKFVGMFTIIYGVISCLTIIGALIGIPTIIIGMRIREAAEQFYLYRLTSNAAALKLGFEIQGKYFSLIKILIIIGLVFALLYIVLIIYLFTTFSAFFSTPNFEAS